MPKCADGDSSRRVEKARPQFLEAALRVRTTTKWIGIRNALAGDSKNIRWSGRSQQAYAATRAFVPTLRRSEVWRLRRIFRDFSEPGDWTHIGSRRRAGRKDDSFRVSGTLWRGTGTDQSQRGKGSGRPLHSTDARLRSESESGSLRV